MNTKNKSSSFPFRRGNGKKRSKSGKGKGGGANYRSLPGGIGDLMSVMPSATKAVAQLISGNTRPSGQVAHARNVLNRAQRAIDDRQTERLPPAIKEEFLEQVALLRLTLADAASHEEDEAAAQEAASEDNAGDEISMDRLRALALSIAGSAKPPTEIPNFVDVDDEDDPEDDQQALSAAVANLKSSTKPTPGKPGSPARGLNSTSDRLRLKSVLDERRNNNSDS